MQTRPIQASGVAKRRGARAARAEAERQRQRGHEQNESERSPTGDGAERGDEPPADVRVEQ